MVKVSKSASILLAGTLFSRTAMFMSVPFLAIYLSTILSLSPTQVGYIIGVNPLVNVLFSLFAGKLIDQFHVKKFLIAIPIAWGIIFILFAFSNQFSQFLILNALNGLCYVIYEPSCKKGLSQYTSSESKLLIFNLRYAAINIGAILGPLLSIAFGFKYTMKPYVLLGIIYIFIGLVNIFLDEDSPSKRIIKDMADSKKVRNRSVIFDNHFRQFLLLLAGVMFSYFGYSQFNSTISQYLSRESAKGIEIYSSLLSLSALAIIILQFPIIRLTKNFQSSLVLGISNLLFGSCLFIIVFSPNYLALIMFTVLYSLGELLLGARFDYAIDQLANDKNRGMFFSCSELIKIGSTMGPIIGGTLISLLGWEQSTLLFGILGSITMIGSFFLFHSKV